MTTSDIIVIGGGRNLSRRKARKLAHQYRGSSRGLRYANYLAGQQAGFFVRNNCLRSLSRAGRVTTITVHSEGAIQSIRQAVSGIKCYSIESPLEVVLQR